MATQSLVSVIILNYHSTQDTVDCLTSLGKQHIVVINISNKHEKSNEGEKLRARFPYIDVVESKNLGFSGGNNVGARYALEHHNPKYLLFLNNDTRVSDNAIQELIQVSEKNLDCLAVYSPKIYFEVGCEYHHEAYKESERGHVLWYAGGLEDKKDVYGWHRGVDELDLGQFDQQESTQFATGCCMFMTTDTFKKVGRWDEKYFLYFEDMDYSRRVLKRDGKVIYVPSAKVWHKNAGSSGGSGSGVHQYYQTRNRIYYGMKFGSLKTKIALVKHSLHANKSSDQQIKRASIDGLIGRMGMCASK